MRAAYLGRHGRQTGGAHRPDDDPGRTALQHLQGAIRRLARLRCGCSPGFSPKKSRKRLSRDSPGGRWTSSSAPIVSSARISSFSNLGLLIVDEEHRFGVSHKEKIKKMKTQVDVLTMTATPIPRTLSMSIMGIRDISIINTPPPNRLSVKTYISEFDPEVIKEAITREISRGGQVFFVHNRIKSMPAMKKYLERLVPEVRIGTAHGQMDEHELERVMLDFVDKHIDVLLSTAIIESGLDIPSANTIIVNRADTFGLAQLYQIRGRVGRSSVRAYAYFLIPSSLVADPRRPQAPFGYQRVYAARFRHPRSPSTTSRSAARETCWAPINRDTSTPSATSCIRKWSSRRSFRDQGREHSRRDRNGDPDPACRLISPPATYQTRISAWASIGGLSASRNTTHLYGDCRRDHRRFGPPPDRGKKPYQPHGSQARRRATAGLRVSSIRKGIVSPDVLREGPLLIRKVSLRLVREGPTPSAFLPTGRFDIAPKIRPERELLDDLKNVLQRLSRYVTL